MPSFMPWSRLCFSYSAFWCSSHGTSPVRLVSVRLRIIPYFVPIVCSSLLLRFFLSPLFAYCISSVSSVFSRSSLLFPARLLVPICYFLLALVLSVPSPCCFHFDIMLAPVHLCCCVSSPLLALLLRLCGSSASFFDLGDSVRPTYLILLLHLRPFLPLSQYRLSCRSPPCLPFSFLRSPLFVRLLRLFFTLFSVLQSSIADSFAFASFLS